MSAVTVRAPVSADAGALGALHNLVWRHAYADLMPASYLAARDDLAAAERWRTQIDGLDADGLAVDGRRTLVALAADELIGFITLGPARRAEHAGMTELMALYVHPQWYGRGVAQHLTRAAFAGRALGGPAVVDAPMMLWVLDGNARAIRFYEKLGFECHETFLIHEPTGARERLMIRPGDSVPRRSQA